jgi:hypothetical protein
MKRQLHTLRRLIQKWSISAIRLVQVPEKKSEYERDAVNICKKLIKLPDSVLLLTPISGKRYITHETQQISVILSASSIQIINHTYSYTVFLGDKQWQKLIDVFNEEVEDRRKVLEEEITSNIKHSLQNILVNIK